MSERKKWLERWIGKGDANKTRDGLQETQGLLDKVGVERKSIELVQKDAHAIAEAVVGRIIDKMEEAGVIDAAVQSNAAADIQSPDDVTQIAAEAALEAIEEVVAEPAEEKSEHDDEDETDKAMSAQLSELQKVNKAQAGAIADMVEDQGEMAKAYVEIVTIVKGLAENDTEAMSRIETLEGLVNSRPRQASKEESTIFDSDELASQLKKTQEDMVFMGIPVTKE